MNCLNPTSPIHSKSAFTLIETLVAVAILSVGMLATMSLLTWTRMHSSFEQERARAHQIVSQEMENIRYELYSTLNAQTTQTVWDNGTPDDTSDDTVGTLERVFFDPETGSTLASTPDPWKRMGVEVTLTWSPRGRLGSTKTYRETIMGYISPKS